MTQYEAIIHSVMERSQFPIASRATVRAALHDIPAKFLTNVRFRPFGEGEEQLAKKGLVLAEYQGYGNIALSQKLFDFYITPLRMRGYYWDVRGSPQRAGVVHELAHKIYDEHLMGLHKRWESLYRRSGQEGRFVSSQAREHAEEGFAEAVVYYLYNPRRLKWVDEEMYRFIGDVLRV